MKLRYFNYECKCCHKKSKFPALTGIPYGEFLMRSAKRNIAYLLAITDKVFNEFSTILKKHPLILGMKDIERAKVMHAIYGYACDLSADGSRFQIGIPPCPYCGKKEPAHWGPINPSETVILEVKPVTYNQWNRLTNEEKYELVNHAVQNYFKEINTHKD